jgi:hypothetical protein
VDLGRFGLVSDELTLRVVRATLWGMYLMRYLRILLHQYWGLMSCAAFTVLTVIVMVFKKSNSWTLGATTVLAGALILVASYFAWRDQYINNEAADGVGVLCLENLEVVLFKSETQPSGTIRVGIVLRNLKARLIDSKIERLAVAVEENPETAITNCDCMVSPNQNIVVRAREIALRDTTRLQFDGVLDYAISYKVRGLDSTHHSSKRLTFRFHTNPIHHFYWIQSQYED